MKKQDHMPVGLNKFDWTKSLVDRIKTIFQIDRDLLFPNNMAKALEEVQKKLNGLPREPSALSLDEQMNKVLIVWKEKGTLEGLETRILRNVPWFLFIGKEPLGGQKGFSEAYGTWLKEHSKSSAVKALLIVFLRDYPQNLPSFHYWKSILITILQRATKKDLIIWRERCEKFFFLEDNGPKKFADLFLNSSKNLDEFLREAGFTNVLMVSKFLSNSILILLESFGEILRKEDNNEGKIRRLLSILLDHKGQLRFNEHRIKIINSLLTPFSVVSNQNRTKVLEIVCKLLLQLFGDPRIDRSAWFGVDEKARQVILRWIARETLEFFFKIIDLTVEKSEYRHQWPYRKAFWYAYYRKGFIVEAWVVLGPSALSRAKDIENWQYNSHGRLVKGDRVLKDHSVLILKFVNGLIVVEWSHNAKGRIWRPGSKNSPKLYKSEYYRHELINGDYEFIHSHSEFYSWQRKVRDYIRAESNIFVSDKDIKVWR